MQKSEGRPSRALNGKRSDEKIENNRGRIIKAERWGGNKYQKTIILLNITEEERKGLTGMDNKELKRKVQDLENIAMCKILSEKYMNPDTFKKYDPKNLAHRGKNV